MATSGRAQGNTISYGNYYFVDWQLTGQSVEGNYSNINWQAYWHFEGSDRQLDDGNVVIDGSSRWDNGGRLYNYTGNFSTRNMLLASGSMSIGHNGDGGKVFNINGSVLGYQGERSSTSVNFDLPWINRYIGINSWSLSGVTEKSLNVNVNVGGTASAVDYSLNGGGWTRGFTGNFSSRTFTINGLQPASTYSVRIRVQNASGGLWTESGVQSTTTTAVLVTSVSVPSKTDATADIMATVSHVADLIQVRPSGTSTWQQQAGTFTTTTIAVSGLTADTAYTYDVRARHLDTQAFTPVRTVSFTTGLPQPLQATNLQPTGGYAIGDLTPTFSWQYNATSTDVQSAYQILLQRSSDAVTMWDSGKVTTPNTIATLPDTTVLAYNVPYQWQVKTWSGSGIEGTYSNLAAFRVSEAPVAVITAPTDGATVSTDIPTITWTYSDPEGTTQKAYRIIITRNGNGVYDQTFNNSTATEFEVPLRVLENGNTYQIEVEVTDQDGITGRSTPIDLTISFIAPPKPSIYVETSDNKLFNLINVESNNPETESFGTDAIKVYRREVGDTQWQYRTTIDATPQYIEEFDDQVGGDWSIGGDSTPDAHISFNSFARQGDNSLSLYKTNAASGGYVYASRYNDIGQVIQYEKIRLWLHLSNNPDFGKMFIRYGTDQENYYQVEIRKTYDNVEVASFNATENTVSLVGEHHLMNGHIIQFSTTGLLPAPLLEYTDYYIRKVDGYTVTLHTSREDAMEALNPIDIVPGGTGTATFRPKQLITDNAWNALEFDRRAAVQWNTPDPDVIAWRAIVVESNSAIPEGDILFDGWSLTPTRGSLAVYDYDIGNNKEYEYAATAINLEEGLESAYSDTVTTLIKYSLKLNTFIIPVYQKSAAVVGFMDFSDLPTWSDETETEYYYPKGLAKPVVYYSGVQQYKRGDITVQFPDECFGGIGIKGVKALEAIKNEKPILLRTYWGETYYISIDGVIQTTRIKDYGWQSSFNFTEIDYDDTI